MSPRILTTDGDNDPMYDPYDYAQVTLRVSELRAVVDALARLVADGRHDLNEPLSKLRRDLQRRDAA